MDPFFERLWGRAATIDEVLSSEFDVVPSPGGVSEEAHARLAAWCRSCASGDWESFARRLDRDELAITDVLARFTAVRPVGAAPTWMTDASWVDAALAGHAAAPHSSEYAFTDVLAPAADAAFDRLTELLGDTAAVLTPAAFTGLRQQLLTELARLAAPTLYDQFDARRDAEGNDGSYGRFRDWLRDGGWRAVFDDEPVLLRLLASLSRQWIEASAELIARLDADLADVRRALCGRAAPALVARVDGGRSDPHHFGRSVAIVEFTDGARVVYKPKDLRVDASWAHLVARLNGTAPVTLRAMATLPRDGYGWTEFVEHDACADATGAARYFERAGAWLALLHCFVSVDMHQENVIAAGEHPVPIDLEMILQPNDIRRIDADGPAYAAAMRLVLDSVLTVGLLPAYGKYSGSKVFAIGGVTSNTSPRTELAWTALDTDALRPHRAPTPTTTTNLPRVADGYARLGDHLPEFVAGFTRYAAYLNGVPTAELLEGFAGLPIRTVLRPTRFYYLLLNRLRNRHAMSDGITWSAQADFVARLADDATWPQLRTERAALVDLNVPHFVAAADTRRAAARLAGFDAAERAWQVEVIEQNTGSLARTAKRPRALPVPTGVPVRRSVFAAAADEAADVLARQAMRRDGDAAWVGLEWVGDSEVSQLVVLGPDLYNGACGIAAFLAAHAVTRAHAASAQLARAAVAPVRAALHGPHSARMARGLGIGGALGVASVAYGLSVVARMLDDGDIAADAQRAASLVSDELISADRTLDVLGGSAGAVLCLLSLYRTSGSDAALARAIRCGRHLLSTDRVGAVGERTWVATAFQRPLNGMSHGAAGYAYALALLAAATGDEDFATAAAECRGFERTTYDAERGTWADLRPTSNGGPPPNKWCYGAPGIGLARAASVKHAGAYGTDCATDVALAVDAATRSWPATTDTLCCGTLGTVELLWEAGVVLERPELGAAAEHHLLAVLDAASARGDQAWSTGTSRFNVGLFRGIAGVGYTALRRLDAGLPNLLCWE